MNLMEKMEIGAQLKRFQENHPKVSRFLKLEFWRGLPEGTVLELRIKKPGEKELVSNMKLCPDDIKLLQKLLSAH